MKKDAKLSVTRTFVVKWRDKEAISLQANLRWEGHSMSPLMLNCTHWPGGRGTLWAEAIPKDMIPDGTRLRVTVEVLEEPAKKPRKSKESK